MAARLPSPGIKEGTVGGVTELVVMGANRAETIHVADNGTNAPGNVTVTLGDGTTYTSHGAVSVIAVMGRGRNDQVSYDLTGNLVAQRSVTVDLGAGNDQFTGKIAGNIDNSSGLNLQVYGGQGNDHLTINQTGKTLEGTFIPYLKAGPGTAALTFNSTGDIAAGAAVWPGLFGGAGHDTIVSNYTGQMNGNYIYNLTESGGPGNANLTDNINILPGSSGTIGTDAQTPAVVRGGKGKDKVHFAINVAPTSQATQVAAVVSGGSARATVEQTANVTTDPTDKHDTVIS